MDNNIQVNSLKRNIGQLEIQLGLKTVNSAISDFTDTQGDFNKFSQALAVLGVPVAQLDTNYYFTSYDNWQKILQVVNPIIQSMNWLLDKRDCDKQAEFVVGLVAYMFELNTIRPFFCDVYRVSDGAYAYTHYAMVFVDDVGNSYLYDYDNGNGAWGKITSNTPIFGNCKYIPKGIK